MGGICFVYPSVLCCWKLLEDRDPLSPPPIHGQFLYPFALSSTQNTLLGAVNSWWVCGKTVLGEGAPKACGPPLQGLLSAFCETKYSPNRLPGHLTPSWGPLWAQAVSCLGLGNPLKSRPPSPDPFQMLIKPFANPGLN